MTSTKLQSHRQQSEIGWLISLLHEYPFLSVSYITQ